MTNSSGHGGDGQVEWRGLKRGPNEWPSREASKTWAVNRC